MGTIRENKELLRLFIVEGLAGDRTLMAEVTTPDFVFHDGDGTYASGREAVDKTAADLVHAFSGLNLHVDDTLAESDLVGAHFIIEGTSEREYADLLPTGQHIKVTGLALARVDGHRISEAWLTFDVAKALRRVPVA